jgi:benzoyl-CoA reductase/2-hydroxyglutaryl-CoA dehydratase subunit BcrC/BadD/HgdB
MTGTWRPGTPHSLVYAPSNTCGFCRHTLESCLNGDFDFLEGAVISNKCDDHRRLFDNIHQLNLFPLSFFMHTPWNNTPVNVRRFATSLTDLRSLLEAHFGVKITDEDIRQASGLYNRVRALVKQLYELRKRDVPPLSGAEYLALTTASWVMRPEEYIQELEALTPYLEQRQATVAYSRPRVMVTSDHLDNPAYIELVESAKCLVAMDDLETGLGQFWAEIDTGLPPIEALALAYLNTWPSTQSFRWLDQHRERIVSWVREWRIDAVINFPQIYCQPRSFTDLPLHQKMEENGIPCDSFYREYRPENFGQLRTRISAFLETLSVPVQ